MRLGDRYVPIRYIFNGYFRSGTTLLWDILKISNPSICVFYEPLHQNLVNLVKKYRKTRSSDNLHGRKLWEEYLLQGEKFINDLSEKNIFRQSIYPFSLDELVNYLDVFNNIDTDTVLQANRLHFYLDEITNHYKTTSFHVLRSPARVYESLMAIYKQKHKIVNAELINILLWLKNFHTPKSDVFSIKKGINYAYIRHKSPYYWSDNKARSIILSDPFKSHVLSWILCNYYACKNENTNVFLYENLITYPEMIEKMIESKTGLIFDVSSVNKKEVDLKHEYMDANLVNTVNNLDLIDEYNFILRRCGIYDLI